MAQGSLWSQPASFWLGAFLVAEVPGRALAGALMGRALRARILEFMVRVRSACCARRCSPWAAVLAVAWGGIASVWGNEPRRPPAGKMGFRLSCNAC